RVDHRRLARAGRAHQREEVRVAEVDVRFVAEGSEAVHVEDDRTHRWTSLPFSSLPTDRRYRAGDVVVQFPEQGRDPRVADVTGGAEVAEQLGGGSRRAILPGTLSLSRSLIRELRVDAHFERVRQDRHDFVTKPGPGWLAQVHPQVVVTESAGQGLQFGHSAVDG